jgi:hypothetical protein
MEFQEPLKPWMTSEVLARISQFSMDGFMGFLKYLTFGVIPAE